MMATTKSKARKSYISDERLAQTLFRHNGNQARAARAVGLTRQAVYERVRQKPLLQAAIVDGREALVDDAEQALRELILERNATAVLFALRTLGKERGYAEKTQHELSGAGGKPIQLEIATLRAALLHEDDYLEYQRRRASESDRDSGLVRADSESGALAAESASAAARPQADRPGGATD